MTCLSDELFAAWAAGELASGERDRAEGHAADCAACRGLALALLGLASRAHGAAPSWGALGVEGTSIGRYQVLGPAGQGAMGVVLRGRDPVLDREVAIKLINAARTTADQRARMLREAQTLARLDHPNIVAVHDAGDLGDEVFVAMELVTGETLGRWVARGPALADRIEVLAGVGAGLAAVHAAGLVHRDVKPDNIVVRGGRTGVLVDFGLARAAALPGPAGSGIAGTPQFLAPEVRAGGLATARSDQHAWWTVVEQTVAGALPRARRRAVEAAIARGRAADPAARFASMDEAVAALRAALAPRRIAGWLAILGLAITGGAVAIAALARAPAAADPCAAE
ncbi:MAG: protein kinase domain-containing protein, partial [Kofleriaceae bacterium]